VTEAREFRHDLLESLVEIVYQALAYASNDFEGREDRFWHLVFDAFRHAFPSIGQEPDGMSPFQQRLAIKLLAKLDDNMKGFYPSICRVLLTSVGPYKHKMRQENRTAFVILKDVFYLTLKQKLRTLGAKDLGKVQTYLPNNVTYNFTKNTLTHSYSDGRQVITRLRTLKIKPISLLSEDIRSPIVGHV